MLKYCKKNIRDENGMIMIEALIVYLVTITLLFFLLVLMFVVFEKWSCQIVANETASKMAQTYSYTNVDKTTGVITNTDLKGRPLYRYLGSNLEDTAKSKAKNYASGRLGQLSFAKMTNQQYETKVIKDNFSRHHIEVKLSGNLNVIFGSVLDYVGLNSNLRYEYVGVSPVYDVSDYLSTLDFFHSITNLDIGSNLVDMINTLLSVFGNMISVATFEEPTN